MFSCLFSLICIVFVCIFVIYIEFFSLLFVVSNSQVIGCEDHLQNDLYCVGWGVKLYLIQFKQEKILPKQYSTFVRMLKAELFDTAISRL